MRISILTAVLVMTAAPAYADSYDIVVAESANNCTPTPPVTLSNKTIRIDTKGNSLTVNLDTIPEMVGTPAKNGRVTAKTAKFLASTFQGLDGKYEIAGKVGTGSDKTIDLVLVAEYRNSSTKKPYCTQSWTIKDRARTPGR
jgi:hypothetical protein